jgi:hypothetical protein
MAPAPEHESAFGVLPDGTLECCFAWSECGACGRVDVAYDGRSDLLPCRCLVGERYGFATPRLLAAYRRARAERFDGKQHVDGRGDGAAAIVEKLSSKF